MQLIPGPHLKGQGLCTALQGLTSINTMVQNPCRRQFVHYYWVLRGIFPLTQKPHCGDSPTLVLPRGTEMCVPVLATDTGNNLVAQQKGTKGNHSGSPGQWLKCGSLHVIDGDQDIVKRQKV